MDELGFGFTLSPALPIASMPTEKASIVCPGIGVGVGVGLPDGLGVGVGVGVACAMQVPFVQIFPTLQLETVQV